MEIVNLVPKKIHSKISDYKILLKNGELIDCAAENYHDISSEDGEMLVYQFMKDKKIILEIEASKIEAILDTSAVNVDQIVTALKKKVRTVRRKKA